MKKVAVLIFVFLLCLSFTSCSAPEIILGKEYTKDTQYAVTQEDIGYSNLFYGEGRYYPDLYKAYSVEEANRSALISWNGGMIDVLCGWASLYFSNTTDSPLYIYDGYRLYFKEGYDYMSKVCIVEGTEFEIPLNQLINPSIEYHDAFEVPEPENDGVIIQLVQKENPNLMVYNLHIYERDGIWFTSMEHITPVYETQLSEAVVQMLKENSIIK